MLGDRSQRDLKHEWDLMCHCWLEDGKGHELRNVGSFWDLRWTLVDSQQGKRSQPESSREGRVLPATRMVLKVNSPLSLWIKVSAVSILILAL